MLSRIAAFFAAMAIALPAYAQLSRPIGGGTSAPHCTSGELATKTGPCSAVMDVGDQVAVVTNASGVSSDLCGITGPTGGLKVACNYSEAEGKWLPIVQTITAASGHAIQLGNTNFVQRANLSFALSLGANVTDFPGSNQTSVIIPTYTTRVASGTNFVGIVTCPSTFSAGTLSGVLLNCTAKVTSFGGVIFSGGSYLMLSGNYDVANPSKTTDGFRIDNAVFGNGCNTTSDDNCGDDFTLFATNVRNLYGTYDVGPLVKVSKKIRLLPGAKYNVDPVNPFTIKGGGWDIDMNGSELFVGGTASTTVRTLAGTGQVTVAGSTGCGGPNSGDPAGKCVILTGGSACGSGTCFDGDPNEIRPGDIVKFGTGNWEDGGMTSSTRVRVVTAIWDNTHFQFEPPLTADFTAGQVSIASGKVFELDNTSTTNAAQAGDIQAATNIHGGGLIRCWNNCQSINPFAVGGARTSPTYRTVPLQGMVLRHAWATNDTQIHGFCGKNDSFLTVTQSNDPSSSSSSGEFTGTLGSCGDWHETEYAIQGADPNSNADDGMGSGVRQLHSDLLFHPKVLIAGLGRAVFAAGNCSVTDYDMSQFENVAQFIWMPEGCQTIQLHGSSQEHSMACTPQGSDPNSFAGWPFCDALAARLPFIDIGPWHPNLGGASVSGYTIDFPKMFFYSRPHTFLRVTDPQPVQIHLNGAVDGTSKLLDIANNNTMVYGHIACKADAITPTTTGCDRPALGTVTDFYVSNFAGSFLWTGRRLDQMDPAVKLPLSAITDDDAHSSGTYELVNGGAGGDPTWAVIGAGGTSGSWSAVTSGTNTSATFTLGSNANFVFGTTTTDSKGLTGTSVPSGNDVALPSQGITIGTTGIVYEGATADAFETNIRVTDPTVDRVITFPDATGSVVTGPATGFINFLGPNVARTWTGPNADATLLTSNTPVTVVQGGTGAAPASDDQIFISSSTSAGAWKSVPDCPTGALNYTASSNTVGCGTGGGGTSTFISDSGSITPGASMTVTGGKGIATSAAGSTMTLNFDGVGLDPNSVPDSAIPNNITIDQSTLASTVSVADAAADTTTFPLLGGSATGSLPPLTDPGLAYNASTNVLTLTGSVVAPTFTGALAGNAATVTTADAASDTTTFPMLATGATGSLAPATDAELSYNASTNVLNVGSVVTSDPGDGSRGLDFFSNLVSGANTIGGPPAAGHCRLGFVGTQLNQYCNGSTETAVHGASIIIDQRINATATNATCLSIYNGQSSTGTPATTCETSATDWYSGKKLHISGYSFTINTGGSVTGTNGCDLALRIGGTNQGTDSEWLDWGSTGLDAAGETQTANVSYTLNAGQAMSLAWVTADAAQCPSGSGCSCAGSATGRLQVWGWEVIP